MLGLSTRTFFDLRKWEICDATERQATKQTNTHRKLYKDNVCTLFFLQSIFFLTKIHFFCKKNLLTKNLHLLLSNKIIWYTKKTLTKNLVAKKLHLFISGNLVTTKLRRAFFCWWNKIKFCEQAYCEKNLNQIKLVSICFCVQKKCDKET